jgi:hypothetical protein
MLTVVPIGHPHFSFRCSKCFGLRIFTFRKYSSIATSSCLRTDQNDSEHPDDPDDQGDHTDCDDAVSDGEPSESSADSPRPEGDQKSCHIEEQFLEVCTENDELRELQIEVSYIYLYRKMIALFCLFKFVPRVRNS